jgi:hypothetical protein
MKKLLGIVVLSLFFYSLATAGTSSLGGLKKEDLSKVPDFYQGNCTDIEKYKLDGILKSMYGLIERFKYKTNFKIGEFKFCNIRKGNYGHSLTFTKILYNPNNIGNGEYLTASSVGRCQTFMILDRFNSDDYLLVYYNPKKNKIGTTGKFKNDHC